MRIAYAHSWIRFKVYYGFVFCIAYVYFSYKYNDSFHRLLFSICEIWEWTKISDIRRMSVRNILPPAHVILLNFHFILASPVHYSRRIILYSVFSFFSLVVYFDLPLLYSPSTTNQHIYVRRCSVDIVHRSSQFIFIVSFIFGLYWLTHILTGVAYNTIRTYTYIYIYVFRWKGIDLPQCVFVCQTLG